MFFLINRFTQSPIATKATSQNNNRKIKNNFLFEKKFLRNRKSIINACASNQACFHLKTIKILLYRLFGKFSGFCQPADPNIK